jgi:predicted membrane channel-forming protein YqfA (hemolysin III family)
MAIPRVTRYALYVLLACAIISAVLAGIIQADFMANPFSVFNPNSSVSGVASIDSVVAGIGGIALITAIVTYFTNKP